MHPSAAILFVIYLVLYGGYVGCAAFVPGIMAHRVGGVGVAVWWGFALIIVPLILALIYLVVRRNDAPDRSAP